VLSLAVVNPPSDLWYACLAVAGLVAFFGWNLWQAAFKGSVRYGPYTYGKRDATGTFWFLVIIYSSLCIFSFGVLVWVACYFLFVKT
jgi:hypothetical protein